MSSFDTAHMTSYWRSVVNTFYVSISCRFWDIQCLKILRPSNHGHGSIKIIESGTIRYTGYGFLLLFYDYSNFVPKTHRFLDIRLQKCRDLEDRVRGTSTSLKMSFWSRISLKRCVIGTQLLQSTTRKSYTIYRMVPLSMTLSDLWRWFQGHDIFRQWISQKRQKIQL